MPIIGGHSFKAARPGEYCQSENCEGVGSFVDLLALADIVQVGDEGIVHTGKATESEIRSIKEAAEELRALMTRVMGF